MRDDEPDRESGDGDAGDRDDRAGAAASSREGVPDAERRNREGNVLLRETGEGGDDRERDEPVLVQEPEGEEEERRRERHRMELVEREPLRRRVEEVREPEAEPGPVGVEVLSRQQEDRPGAERDRGRLGRQQHRRIGPEPPEGSESREDRVEVRAEPRDLLALEIGDGEHVAVCGRPHRLRHVAEVEPAGTEREMAQDREGGEAGREGGDGRPEDDDGPEAHRRLAARSSSASRRPRQRWPRTSSLACSP